MGVFEFTARLDELISRYPKLFTDQQFQRLLLESFADRDSELEDYLDLATSVSEIGVTNVGGVVQNNTQTQIGFTAQAFTSGSAIVWDSDARLTVQRPGVYMLTAGVDFDANSLGTYRNAWITLNGATKRGCAGPPPSSGSWGMSSAGLFNVVAGDWFGISLAQNVGGNLTFNAALECAFRGADQ